MANRKRSTILRESQATAPVVEADPPIENDADDDDDYTSLITALWVPSDAAAALAIDGGEAPEDLHVTLGYFGDPSALGETAVARVIVGVESIAQRFGPIVATVSGVGRFQGDEPGGKDVVYASVDAPGLSEFRACITDCMANCGVPASREHGFTPHITLAYVDQGAPLPVETIKPQTIRFDAITVAVGSKRITLPLAAPQPMYYESHRPAPGQPGADPAQPGAPVELSESDGRFLADISEATSAKGNAWDVLLIKAGTSGNARHYPASVLESAVPLFEGARAYADHPTRDEQRNRPERSIRDVVGWFESVRWDGTEQGIRGTFRILESADWLRTALKSAWDQGKKDLLGFSINALGRVGSKRADNSTLIEAIEKVVSTDVVTTPGAGGRLLGVLESERNAGTGPEGEMDPEEIKRLIAEAMAAGLTGLQAQLSESLTTQVATAVATLTPAAGAVVEPVVEVAKPDPAAEALREAQSVLAEIKRQNRVTAISARIDAAKLPATHTLRIKTRILEALTRRDVEDVEVDGEISFARELIAESGPARVSWGGMTVQAGDSPHDKLVKGLQGWFEGKAIDGVPAVRDIRESYALWHNVGYLDADPFQLWNSFRGGYDSGAHHKGIQESLGTADWGQVFADVFYLQMIKTYRDNPDYENWRKIVSDIENVPDFRTRHWSRIGGYGDFSSVAEKGTYPTITSPGDEEVTYSLTKYGGIDDISLEMILGDRLGQVRRLPMLMANAAIRTLYKFVMNLVTTTNPTMDYDSVALYHASHANTGTTALSVAGLDAVNVAMRSQTLYGQSSEIAGTRNKPRYVIVPTALESLARRVLDPSDAYLAAISNTGTDTTMDAQRWKGQGIEPIVYDQLTDTNDWFTVADPAQVPTLVVGFLNGNQSPELFTQDQPNVGAVFTADKVSYKLRFIFGGDVLDHRALYRQVV